MEYIGKGRGFGMIFHDELSEERKEEIRGRIFKNSDVQSFLLKHQNKLSDKEMERSFSKLYEYVSQKQKFLNNDKTYVAPGYEPKLIFSSSSIDVVYEPTEELVEQQKRAKILAVNIPKETRKASFQNLTLTDDANRMIAIQKIKKFGESLVANPEKRHRGIYLYGNFGIGKTYLMGALANELALKGFATTLLHFPSFLMELQNAMNSQNNVVGDRIENIKKAQVLVLDDIGAESVTSWARDTVLMGIVQYRMQEELPTLFTSNRDFEGLEKYLCLDNKGNNESVQAKRVMERVKFLSEEVLYGGENVRNL
ncbi:MAG: primosomal protein DnaI [Lactobacillales bacterium]|jgi:primosomal protein DnaI|nr:primosomal protein DnaI [Lactobacillales bacterium]